MILAKVLAAIRVGHQREQPLLRARKVADDVVNFLGSLGAQILRRVVEEMKTFRDGGISLASFLVLVADFQNFVDQRLCYLFVPSALQDARTFDEHSRMKP